MLLHYCDGLFWLYVVKPFLMGKVLYKQSLLLLFIYTKTLNICQPSRKCCRTIYTVIAKPLTFLAVNVGKSLRRTHRIVAAT